MATSSTEVIPGGWTTISDDAAKPILDYIRQQMRIRDPTYEILHVLLAQSQVVAGTNFRFMLDVSVEDSESGQCQRAFVFRSLTGDLSLSQQIREWDPTPKEQCGGWTDATPKEVQAAEDFVKTQLQAYSHLILLGQKKQLVAGMNYSMVFSATHLLLPPSVGCLRVHVYNDLQNVMKLTSTSFQTWQALIEARAVHADPREYSLVGGWRTATETQTKPVLAFIQQQMMKRDPTYSIRNVFSAQSQVVDGTNVRFILNVTVEGHGEYCQRVQVWEKPTGEMCITSNVISEWDPTPSSIIGGYSAASSDEVKPIVEFIASQMQSYSILGSLSAKKQIVNGTNYRLVLNAKHNLVPPTLGCLQVGVYKTLQGAMQISSSSFQSWEHMADAPLAQAASVDNEIAIVGFWKPITEAQAKPIFDYIEQQMKARDPMYRILNMLAGEEQVVAGTNYRLVLSVAMDARTLCCQRVQLWKTVSGDIHITQNEISEWDPTPVVHVGGWTEASTAEVAPVVEFIESKSYTILTCLSKKKQLVAGMNYSLVLSVKRNLLPPTFGCLRVHVYEDLHHVMTTTSKSFQAWLPKPSALAATDATTNAIVGDWTLVPSTEVAVLKKLVTAEMEFCGDSSYNIIDVLFAEKKSPAPGMMGGQTDYRLVFNASSKLIKAGTEFCHLVQCFAPIGTQLSFPTITSSRFVEWDPLAETAATPDQINDDVNFITQKMSEKNPKVLAMVADSTQGDEQVGPGRFDRIVSSVQLASTNGCLSAVVHWFYQQEGKWLVIKHAMDYSKFTAWHDVFDDAHWTPQPPVPNMAQSASITTPAAKMPHGAETKKQQTIAA